VAFAARGSRGQAPTTKTEPVVKSTLSTGASKTKGASVASAAAVENQLLRDQLIWTFGGKQQRGWYLYDALLGETLGPAGHSASITRDLAIGRAKLGIAMLATDNATGLAELRDAVTSLRRLAGMDLSDARARRDLNAGDG